VKRINCWLSEIGSNAYADSILSEISSWKQKECIVPTNIREVAERSLRTRESSYFKLSPAKTVKVIAATLEGSTPLSLISLAIRLVKVVVLPEPAQAKIHNCLASEFTAASCSTLSVNESFFAANFTSPADCG